MKYEETYNSILNIAKRLERPRSFSEVLTLLKENNLSPKTFFDSINEHYDDLICSFIISRTKYEAQLGVKLYYEREMVATILSSVKVVTNDAFTANSTFSQRGLTFRLPAVLNDNRLLLIKDIVIANNCVEICRIGQFSEKIYEISFYAKPYIAMPLAKIMPIQKDFSEALRFTLDNILKIEETKKKIVETLKKHGRLSNIMQNDSIDPMFHALDRELAALEVVLGAKKSNQNITENNITDHVTLWLLFRDLNARTVKMYDKIKTENSELKPQNPNL